MSYLSRIFSYETKGQRLLPTLHFAHRVLGHVALVAVLAAVSLTIGMAGYEHWEHLDATDAFLNAAMLLGGMGPVNPPQTPSGKLFAGSYALYAGLVFLACAAILIGPVVHRVLHRLHWSEDA